MFMNVYKVWGQTYINEKFMMSLQIKHNMDNIEWIYFFTLNANY